MKTKAAIESEVGWHSLSAFSYFRSDRKVKICHKCNSKFQISDNSEEIRESGSGVGKKSEFPTFRFLDK